MGEGGLPCSRNCADSRASRDGSPLSPGSKATLRKREVSASVQRTMADRGRAGRNVWDWAGDEERDVRDKWAEGGVAVEWDGKRE